MKNNPTIDGTKPRVGVSQCLLGDAVRYDGQSRPCEIVIQRLAALFELVPVCPEVEAGFGVPRPAVQLSGNIDAPRMTGRDRAGLDITAPMLEYCERRLAELDALDGYIFKSRSPSCGLNSTPVFVDGNCVTDSGRGLFAREFCKRYPTLPVIEDTELERAQSCDTFIRRVQQRARGTQT